MKCTNCGTEFEGRFCSNCGTPAPIANAENFLNKCAQCGTEYEGKYCPNCGESANSGPQSYPKVNKKKEKKVKKKKPIYKRLWFIVLVAIILISAVGEISDGIFDSITDNINEKAAEPDMEINDSHQEPETVKDIIVENGEEAQNEQSEVDNEIEDNSNADDELNADGLRTDFKKAMDSYESFMNEYVDFLNAYEQNSSDLTLIAKYAEYMIKYEKLCNDFDEWEDEDLNDAELAYYIAVQSRVSQKLLEVAG